MRNGEYRVATANGLFVKMTACISNFDIQFQKQTCWLKRVVPIKHDAPGDDVPHGHSVKHFPRVPHAPARRVRPGQRGSDKPIVQCPCPDGQRVRGRDVRASTLAARSGAEQGRKRSGPRCGQAGAAEAGAGGEHEAWGRGGGGTDGGEEGPVRVRVGRRRWGDGVAAAEEDGSELTEVVLLLHVHVHWLRPTFPESYAPFRLLG
jgi:hypothetical protein